jgi:hypothetical protein
MGVGPNLAIRRPARVIAKRCTLPENRTSVFIRAASQRESQHVIYVIAPGPPSALPSILRSSAFKAHLKRHGEQYVEMFKHQETSAKAGGSTRIEEEQTTVQGVSADQMNMLDSLPDAWGFPSFPEDSCKNHRHVLHSRAHLSPQWSRWACRLDPPLGHPVARR